VNTTDAPRIGIVGGTGPAGRGLAARLAFGGTRALLGSRDLARAEAAVKELHDRWGDSMGNLVPVDNATAASDADLVILAVSAEATVPTAIEHRMRIAGKIVVSMANGMRKVAGGFAPVISPLGSIAQEVAAGAPEARIVAAFQHLPAPHLLDLEHPLEDDVLVSSDDDGARQAIHDIVECIPHLRAIDAGPLANASALEALTAVLVTVNINYKTHAGLRLTGMP
jgi:NADPH-dependent F420 reductase